VGLLITLFSPGDLRTMAFSLVGLAIVFFLLLFSANEHPAIVDTIVYMILEKKDMYIWLPAASNPFSCVREYLMYMALLYS